VESPSSSKSQNSAEDPEYSSLRSARGDDCITKNVLPCSDHLLMGEVLINKWTYLLLLLVLVISSCKHSKGIVADKESIDLKILEAVIGSVKGNSISKFQSNNAQICIDPRLLAFDQRQLDPGNTDFVKLKETRMRKRIKLIKSSSIDTTNIMNWKKCLRAYSGMPGLPNENRSDKSSLLLECKKYKNKVGVVLSKFKAESKDKYSSIMVILTGYSFESYLLKFELRNRELIFYSKKEISYFAF
jgi:hypothetical protein